MNTIRKVIARLDAANYAGELRKHIDYQIRKEWLVKDFLSSKECGVSSERLCDNEIVVSLTTYGKRLYDVAATIESIMQGSVKPNKIVLWLEDALCKAKLPEVLRKQQDRGLEIFFCKDIRSYKKLIPSLHKYPNSVIITIDDDALYQYDLVENLVNMHLDNPKNIIANRIHRMVLGKDGRPLSYMKWKWGYNSCDVSPLNFFTGVGGVLYPPNVLDEEVANQEIFMEICKYADDVWFNAMALKKGTRIIKGMTRNASGVDWYSEAGENDGLNKINVGNRCANDYQLIDVFNKYNLWSKLNCE